MIAFHHDREFPRTFDFCSSAKFIVASAAFRTKQGSQDHPLAGNSPSTGRTAIEILLASIDLELPPG